MKTFAAAALALALALGLPTATLAAPVLTPKTPAGITPASVEAASACTRVIPVGRIRRV
jgi:hypothetical protein